MCTRMIGSQHWVKCSSVDNPHDPYAVKVMKAGTIVEHLPKKISSTCSLLIRKGGTIDCEVTDPNRKYSRDLAQGGMEIPCVLTLRGVKDLVDKAVKLPAIGDRLKLHHQWLKRSRKIVRFSPKLLLPRGLK